MWYHRNIGGERCPIVDTWWQTETGGHMIYAAARGHHDQAGLGHVRRSRASAPSSSTTPATRSTAGGGYLTLTRPWPSMLRGIWGDPERYRETYWSDLSGPVLRRRRGQDRRRRLPLAARPGRRRDERVRPPHLDHRGRVGARRPPRGGRGRGGRRHRRHHRAGHRRLRHPARRHRGQPTSSARRSASTWPRSSGRSPGPRTVVLVPDLPKTRSGKIMRRLLRDVAEGRDLGDTTTLADPTVVRGDPRPGRATPQARTEGSG